MSISKVIAAALSLALYLSIVGQTESCLGQSIRRATSTPDGWVKRLTTIRSDRQKFNDGEKVPKYDVGIATLNWMRATKNQFGEKTEGILSPSLKLVPKFEPFWKTNKVQLELMNRCMGRMQYLSRDEIERWTQALSKLSEPPEPGQMLFYLVTTDRLFDTKGLKAAEANTMLKHLEALTDAQIDAVAQAVGIDKSRAAFEMAQEDWLFKDTGVDVAAFDAAKGKLDKALGGKK